jgi:hypothetical protein
MDKPVILNPQGQPARRPVSDVCPKCGAGPDKRVPSGGFGPRHPVCNGGCSPAYEWVEEVWHG